MTESKGRYHWSLPYSLLMGWIVITYLLFINPMKDKVDNVYSTDKLEPALLDKIKFHDITFTKEIVYSHLQNSSKGIEFLSALSPSVLIYDFNKDGLMDIFYSGGNRNFLYINQPTGPYIESAEEYGLLGEKEKDSTSSMAIMADFNRDGEDDLYLTCIGKHKLFYREKNKNHFRNVSEKLSGYSSSPDGANVVDFNQDGLLDIVVGNFIEYNSTSIKTPWYMPRRYGVEGGGKNELLIQGKDGNFHVDKNVDFLSHSYTHSVGISNINDDAYPDIFFANDYAKDEMFMNDGGKRVVDVTAEYIPMVWHGNSGMNAEFMDYDQDGLMDLYVTYIHKPPFYRAYNILWKKEKETNHFQPVSWDKNIGRCGFSWGAKFADFNLDGELDLFVVNGRDKNTKLKNMKDGKSFWYTRTQLTSLPGWLLGYLKDYERGSDKLFYTSAFERDCLFIQNKGEFYDIAVELGLTDAQEGRGLALADLDNNGLMDIIVTNTLGTSRVYQNDSQYTGSWIGFKLKNKYGSMLPIGASVRLYLSNGKVLFREYYPANGYRGQSDSRVHFGLPANVTPVKLEILWPGKKEKSEYTKFQVNSYNLVEELI